MVTLTAGVSLYGNVQDVAMVMVSSDRYAPEL